MEFTYVSSGKSEQNCIDSGDYAPNRLQRQYRCSRLVLEDVYLPNLGSPSMALKKTSDVVAISFGIDESGANTFTQSQVNLTLDPLNNEVFVVLAVDLDVGTPSAQAATNTQSTMAVTTTSKTAMPTLADSQMLARVQSKIQAAGFVDGGVAFQHTSPDSPTGELDYIGIIATNNMFVQIQGGNNVGALAGAGRVYGYRARADSSTYGALVQSEVLSS